MIFFTNLSLRNRVLLMIGMASALCAVVSIAGFLYFNEKAVISGIENKERTIHTQLEAATDYVARQGGLSGVIAKYKAKYNSADQLTEDDKQEILKAVPIYAAIVIGHKNAEKDHYAFRVFSDEPRRKENQAKPEELAILKQFADDLSLNEKIVNDGATVTTYRPVRLSKEQGCLNCHGNPSTSPWGDGRDILGYRMENWADGKLHGVFAISQDVAKVTKAANGDHLVSPAGWLIMAILLGAAFAVFIGAFLVRGPIAALAQVAATLSTASSEVSAASQRIASGAQELSSATSEQAASLEETAASIEQMSSMVTKNSENAKNTSENSDASLAKAEEGKTVVGEMLRSMDEINQSNVDIMSQINQSNAEMAEVVKVIQEIGTKTKVINDIVFQTKLLSFNASVEAARAGEHGKGFAVVAEEVGNLAAMSGNAAKEISNMLEGSIQKVESMATTTKARVEGLIEVGKTKVQAGTEVAKRCSSVLNEIVTNVTNVSQMSGEISNASQEQAQGVQELTKAMHQLDQVTQQNSATSEQSAAQAQQLSGQAVSLTEAVTKLIATIEGVQAAPTPAEDQKVIPLPKRPQNTPLKKAAGAEQSTPGKDHPGFKEV